MRIRVGEDEEDAQTERAPELSHARVDVRGVEAVVLEREEDDAGCRAADEVGRQGAFDFFADVGHVPEDGVLELAGVKEEGKFGAGVGEGEAGGGVCHGKAVGGGTLGG